MKPSTSPRTGVALMWRAAGQPAAEQAEPAPPGAGCWWCGVELGGSGRPITSLPDSFHATIPRGPALLDSAFLCHACGWSLSDWVALPRAVWGPQLQAALDGDGKVSLSLGGDRGAKACICRGPGSTVYVFARPPQGKRGAPLEAAWLAARPAAASGDLSAMPAELPLLATLDEADVGAAMVGKFRNYDHLVIEGAWHALKAQRPSDREVIRGVLLKPPPSQWSLSMGDGQKHCAYLAPISDGRVEVQSVYCNGPGLVCYTPADLAQVLQAMEELIRAGAHPEEVLSGAYRPRGDAQVVLAVRTWDPIIRPWRGAALLELAEAIRPSTDVIRATPPAPAITNAAPAPQEPAHDRAADPGAGVPQAPERARPRDPPAPGPRADGAPRRQLSLFG